MFYSSMQTLIGTGGGTEQPMAGAAIKAFALQAVGIIELNDRLRHQRTVNLYAGRGKQRGDAVALRRQFFEQVDGTLRHFVVVGHFTIHIIKRGHSVDKHDVDRAFADGSRLFGRLMRKRIVAAPVARQLHAEQRAQAFLVALCFKNVGKQAETIVHIMGKQRYAPPRKILRTHAERLPHQPFGAAEHEFGAQIVVLALQLFIVFVTVARRPVEQSGLTEKQGLQLEKRVGMLVEQRQRQAFRQPFESVVVRAETDIARQRNVARILPTAMITLKQFLHAAAFFL